MGTVREWLLSSSLDSIDKSFMLEHVCGMNKAAQLIHGDRILTPEETNILNDIANRRSEGVPLPYLLGSQEFFGHTFHVNSSVLIPRPDTECFVEWLLAHLPKKALICDLGTGSGCIAATLALERPDLSVWASDLSEDALAVAQSNCKALGADVKLVQGSWLDPYPAELTFDAIISNPPYIEGDDEHLDSLRYEPRSALTDEADGLIAYRVILPQIRRKAPEARVIAFEHGWNQGEAVRSIFEENGFEGAETFRDYGNNPRFTAWLKA